MSLFEKIYSVGAVLFALFFLAALFAVPEARQLKILLPAGLVAVTVNIGLMFIVLRDIFYRNFDNPVGKYVWLAVVLFFWPAIIYYLPRHGFKKRQDQ